MRLRDLFRGCAGIAPLLWAVVMLNSAIALGLVLLIMETPPTQFVLAMALALVGGSFWVFTRIRKYQKHREGEQGKVLHARPNEAGLLDIGNGIVLVFPKGASFSRDGRNKILIDSHSRMIEIQIVRSEPEKFEREKSRGW